MSGQSQNQASSDELTKLADDDFRSLFQVAYNDRHCTSRNAEELLQPEVSLKTQTVYKSLQDHVLVAQKAEERKMCHGLPKRAQLVELESSPPDPLATAVNQCINVTEQQRGSMTFEELDDFEVTEPPGLVRQDPLISASASQQSSSSTAKHLVYYDLPVLNGTMPPTVGFQNMPSQLSMAKFVQQPPHHLPLLNASGVALLNCGSSGTSSVPVPGLYSRTTGQPVYFTPAGHMPPGGNAPPGILASTTPHVSYVAQAHPAVAEMCRKQLYHVTSQPCGSSQSASSAADGGNSSRSGSLAASDGVSDEQIQENETSEKARVYGEQQRKINASTANDLHQMDAIISSDVRAEAQSAKAATGAKPKALSMKAPPAGGISFGFFDDTEDATTKTDTYSNQEDTRSNGLQSKNSRWSDLVVAGGAGYFSLFRAPPDDLTLRINWTPFADKQFTNDEVREKFSGFGEITDMKSCSLTGRVGLFADIRFASAAAKSEAFNAVRAGKMPGFLLAQHSARKGKTTSIVSGGSKVFENRSGASGLASGGHVAVKQQKLENNLPLDASVSSEPKPLFPAANDNSLDSNKPSSSYKWSDIAGNSSGHRTFRSAPDELTLRINWTQPCTNVKAREKFSVFGSITDMQAWTSTGRSGMFADIRFASAAAKSRALNAVRTGELAGFLLAQHSARKSTTPPGTGYYDTKVFENRASAANLSSDGGGYAAVKPQKLDSGSNLSLDVSVSSEPKPLFPAALDVSLEINKPSSSHNVSSTSSGQRLPSTRVAQSLLPSSFDASTADPESIPVPKLPGSFVSAVRASVELSGRSSPEPPPPASIDPKGQEAVEFFRNALTQCGPSLSVNDLWSYRVQASVAVRAQAGRAVEAFTAFLAKHPEAFVVNSKTGKVSLQTAPPTPLPPKAKSPPPPVVAQAQAKVVGSGAISSISDAIEASRLKGLKSGATFKAKLASPRPPAVVANPVPARAFTAPASPTFGASAARLPSFSAKPLAQCHPGVAVARTPSKMTTAPLAAIVPAALPMRAESVKSSGESVVKQTPTKEQVPLPSSKSVSAAVVSTSTGKHRKSSSSPPKKDVNQETVEHFRAALAKLGGNAEIRRLFGCRGQASPAAQLHCGLDVKHFSTKFLANNPDVFSIDGDYVSLKGFEPKPCSDKPQQPADGPSNENDQPPQPFLDHFEGAAGSHEAFAGGLESNNRVSYFLDSPFHSDGSTFDFEPSRPLQQGQHQYLPSDLTFQQHQLAASSSSLQPADQRQPAVSTTEVLLPVEAQSNDLKATLGDAIDSTKKKKYTREELLAIEEKWLQSVCAPVCLPGLELKSNWSATCDTFEDMQLREDLLRGMRSSGVCHPTPLQKLALVPSCSGRNVVAQADAGSGKATALAIAILQRIDPELRECQALVLVHDAEGAEQIRRRIAVDFGKFMPTVKLGLCVVQKNQNASLSNAQIIVGQANRLFDAAKQHRFRTDTIKLFALNDAAEVCKREFRFFNYHFAELLQKMPSDVQVLLCCKRMSFETRLIMRDFIARPVRIYLDQELPPRLTQSSFLRQHGLDSANSTCEQEQRTRLGEHLADIVTTVTEPSALPLALSLALVSGSVAAANATKLCFLQDRQLNLAGSSTSSHGGLEFGFFGSEVCENSSRLSDDVSASATTASGFKPAQFDAVAKAQPPSSLIRPASSQKGERADFDSQIAAASVDVEVESSEDFAVPTNMMLTRYARLLEQEIRRGTHFQSLYEDLLRKYENEKMRADRLEKELQHFKGQAKEGHSKARDVK